MAKINFELPDTIKNDLARTVITGLVRQLKKDGKIGLSDIPQLHRMATAFDAYLTCVDVLNTCGRTMINLKGEIVKRPEANLLKENWSQYFEIAKEYGLTFKSKGQIKSLSAGEEKPSPLEKFLNREK